ncbi:hypothetical protein COW36_03690 [bacterium (Candidatus Blackallbacteria) CG17_big_fil_post_rev_8_21_14_2_50_48_46]|uniref:YkgJ family cysteine cluster protein n=1 Tax=bacterium (Candidatus Blackallbacteria) CG17_big_fil_post_rev_8_21_14_2_50_48_46 TaxID=2014261 RepID=A0A2M7G8G8_9BACT|nr:MAG: hypothetical protein COW64_20860 [bacterium (Candidatus Blackallbacteria) CG18_big_fil_WC_8_21_14_2_50_49_26]PIW18403.1 MAG: hypothetical protein COW36_03690 [bacterium (Candidatus Blackallbacteria) CG17_big_fil_post_rev_8_21_14_2_50_48_46]PIW50562.1 MAG: hypothetical protein COW20_02115 [bacterium (Candidatus Blackallbacteria) CG13_big_fil_rev_8_21_14_2_50_49_14]
MQKPEELAFENAELQAFYSELSPAQKAWVAEINFLAEELKDNLILEQFLLGVDLLTERLQALIPQIGCAQGCSRCCESFALPEVTSVEWELVQAALAELPETQKKRIETALESISPQLFDSAGWPRHPRQAYAAFKCPLLLDGKCAIYAWRPFACRAQGYFFSHRLPGERPLPQAMQALLMRKKPLPLSCHEEQKRIQTALMDPHQSLFYAFFPLADRLMQILDQIDGEPSKRKLLVTHLLQELKQNQA